MKKETKLVIGEILLWLEGHVAIQDIMLEELDISDNNYIEAKQEFNRLEVE